MSAGTGIHRQQSGMVWQRPSVRWIAACLGLLFILSACTGETEVASEVAADFVVVTNSPPEPLFEPAGSQGSNPFFTVDEQISATNAALVEETVTRAKSSGVEVNAALANVRLTSPSDEEIKSGLYGGSLENTCDPERLIQHLLDNPTQGQVWADVQDITFEQIPDFIRSLTPAMLEVDTLVLNHGYDPKGHAIPIVSTLAAGTAVLLDDDGNVRTRCYCGNPILPYEPTEYEPPQCLTHFAVVYLAPNQRERIDGVPRSVNATNEVATWENVAWTEITWNGNVGWVRTNESQTRYCKPPELIVCVNSAQITQDPGSEEWVGEVQDGFVSVVVQDLGGWSLIKFAETSGWIQVDALAGTGCRYDVDCITSSSGTWSRPGQAGQQIVAAGQPQRLEYTGQSFIDNTGTYRQVYVTYPSPTRIGYIRDADVTPASDSNCELVIGCPQFDVDVPVYDSAEGSGLVGVLWYGEVDIVSGPTNNRYEISWGPTTAWVEATYLHGTNCEPVVECIVAGSAYEPLPTTNGTRAMPGGPIVVTFTGHVAIDANNTSTYREFTSPAVSGGSAWIETAVGYTVLPWSDCEVKPECMPDTQVCEVYCTVRQVGDSWEATVWWQAKAAVLDVQFTWAQGGTHYFGFEQSGVTDTVPWAPQSTAVRIDWWDNLRGTQGDTTCHLNVCELLPFDGDIGYPVEPFSPEVIETCPRVQCSFESSINEAGIPQETIVVNWTPPVALDVLDVDWPNGQIDESRTNVLPPQVFTQAAGQGGPVTVSWITGTDPVFAGSTSCGGVVYEPECSVVTQYSFPDGITYIAYMGISDPAVNNVNFTWEQTPPPDKVDTVTGSSPFTSSIGFTVGSPQVGNLVIDYIDPATGETVFAECARIECEELEAGTATLVDGTNPCRCSDEDPGKNYNQFEDECYCNPPLVDGPNGTCIDFVPTPTATPSPTATPTPSPTAVPPPPTPSRVEPTPVPTPIPPPTSTPTPVCELGATPSGECYRICDVGDLLTTNTCKCIGQDTRPSADGIQCVVICPAGQVNLSVSECGVLEVETPQCPAGTVPVDGTCQAVQDGRCEPPLVWNPQLGRCTD